MAAKALPPPKALRQLLRYEPDTGKLFWLPRDDDQRWTTQHAGKEAFTSTGTTGYKRSTVLGRVYTAHRVAWAIKTGEWPTREVDHVNGQRDDNRWANLRSATKSQNMHNSRRRTNNTSGAKGVSWDKEVGKWMAYITVQRKRYNLGRFKNIADAAEAYRAASQKLHGDFGRLA